MYLSEEKALMALQLLIEGNSIRSTMRVTGVDGNTIMKMLILAGERCEKVMGRLVVNVPCKDVQCDEISGYVGKKEGHKLPSEADNDSIGDAYRFVAIERYTKLILNFALGRRSQATTDAFIEGLRAATSSQRFQISTDGFQPYKSAITTTLSDRCDFAQLIKVYTQDPEGAAPVQSSRCHAYGEGPSHGEPGSQENLHISCGTPKSHHPHADAPPHAVDQRVLEEVGEPLVCLLPPLRLL
jgi:hypothetical protein